MTLNIVFNKRIDSIYMPYVDLGNACIFGKIENIIVKKLLSRFVQDITIIKYIKIRKPWKPMV